MARSGALPLTQSLPPIGRSARALLSRRCAPRSRPKPLISITVDGDVPVRVIEPRLVHRAFERRVTFEPSLTPDLEPFQVEERANLRVFVGHAHQQLAEARHEPRR